MEYLIKEVSEKLNISVYTLRYYDKEGLTPFVKKDNKGIRRYTDDDLEWIKMLINLRDIDMPISNIKEYIQLFIQGDDTIEERRKLMCQYRDYVKKKVQDTIENLEKATKKLCEYDSAVADILSDDNLY